MTHYWFQQAYLNNSWHSNVRISVSDKGEITHVQPNEDSKDATVIKGLAIPGIPNIHSHAFQRAMAGLTEEVSSPKDTFWTWRNIMYQFANMITPEDQLNISAQLYMEMLKAGYTSVGEFHYLHNESGNQPYANPIELSLATIRAAQLAGIGLTHLPVLYMSSHFGGAPLKAEQLRFQNSVDSFHSMLQAISSLPVEDKPAKLGMAIHSLRAVSPDAISEILKHLNKLDQEAPIHIHIAEQTQEVDDCISWSGKRPVEWLLDEQPVDERWCLVHATHLSDEEIKGVAQSGAVVGICPTTEANLGDGFFPLADFLDQGGNIAIGSDSNTSVNPIEELRWLEYGQRLNYQKRNIAASEETPHTAQRLIDQTLSGGAAALGRKIGKIAPGFSADILVLDSNSPHLYGKPTKSILDALVFCGNTPLVKDVLRAGNWVVKNYNHFNELEITENYCKTIARLQKTLT